MRAARVAAALVIVATGLSFGAGAAGAWSDGACPSSDGVTVVVDFQELGGGVQVRCAPGHVDSGFAALAAADINYQTTIRYPGFLCKIAGLPSNDPCINASPATAYWSYWLAPRGGQWCYSNWGAGNRTPPAGSVEGWSFSKDHNASTSPPPRLAPPPAVPGSPASLPVSDCDQSSAAPKPTTPPPTSPPATAAPLTAPTNPPVTAGTPTTSPSVVRSATTVAPRGDTTTVPSGDTTTAVDSAVPPVSANDSTTIDTLASTTSVDTGERLLTERKIDLSSGNEGGGSPVGVIVTLVLLTVLGGAAVVLRRRSERG